MGEGSNPFNPDLSELMRMLQSPDELAKIMRMLQSPGPVNMELARDTAESIANVDPQTHEPHRTADRCRDRARLRRRGPGGPAHGQ